MATATTSAQSPSALHLPAVTDPASPRAFPSIRLWPPNSSTRSTLVQRLSDHLSSASFFSERYGRIGAAEANLHAQRIEQQAFPAATQHAEIEGSDIAVVQFYAKEASRLMLECLKKGPSISPESPKKPTTQACVFDISGGSREFLTEATTQELLKPLSVPANAYSSICFSNRSFGLDAAKVAGKILESLRSQLVYVNLADIVAGRNEDEALLVMSIFSKALSGATLKYLNLSDNALGEKGVRAFSELLVSQNVLEELFFMNNGISEEAAVAICELLPSSNSLRVLHFHNNMTGDGGAVALSKLVKSATVLEDFRCSSTRVGSDGGIALAEALQAGTKLRRIDLRDNPIGVEGALALAKSLKQHTDLTEVYLSYLGFEDEGCEAILDALEGAKNLEILELAGNDLTVESVKRLATFIASKPKLVRLNLSENELEDKGVVTVCNAIQKGLNNFAELDLCETSIGRIGACAAAKAVSMKEGFKMLSLNGNHISESGIEALKAELQKGANGISVLGPLDENNEDEADDDEDEEDATEDGNESENEELQSQFENVRV